LLPQLVHWTPSDIGRGFVVLIEKVGPKDGEEEELTAESGILSPELGRIKFWGGDAQYLISIN